MKFLGAILSLVFLASCVSSEKRPPSLSLEEAVKSPYRSSENVQRDVYRHPLATLEFFGVEPTMTVVEITPGAGWYMEILAPFLAADGKYVAAIFPEDSETEYMINLNKRAQSWLEQHPEVGGRAAIARFNLEKPESLVPEGGADAVLTFRNVHSWASQGKEDVAFKMFFDALKPGGTLGVVAHRARKKSDPKKGYLTEAEVIQMAKKAGFALAAKSEINANPKDTADHPEGVWTLPPSLRLKDVDREKYLNIGESDRMTLKFIKPVKI